MAGNVKVYDVVGDIHGHADELEALLTKLGYRESDGIYQQDGHQVIFLGDFIDRGPDQRRVIDVVRPMIELGYARSVMGNHEFNAICYATKDSSGNYLREHSEKNLKQHRAFLEAYPDEAERADVVQWFKTLPVFIETEGFRVVHACWDIKAIKEIQTFLNGDLCLAENAYPACSQAGSDAFHAVEVLLKGPEIDLPEGVTFKDKDGHVRKNARIKWWKGEHESMQDRLALTGEVTESHRIDELSLDAHHHYSLEHKPVFVGHYWLNHSTPDLLSENCACLDYSVAKEGKLVAYRWQGESVLNSSHFIWC